MKEQHSIENYPTKEEEEIAERIANKVGESISQQLNENLNKENMEEKKQNCDGCKYSDEEMKIIERAEKDVRKAMGGALGLPKDIPYLYSFVGSALELGWLDKYKEYSNSSNIGKDLRPFDLEAAQAGKPVCTRDGRKARIICFDRVINSTNECKGHLIVLVTNSDGDEQSFYYTEKGNLVGKDKCDSKHDLMMLPEKKEGWINVYKERCYETREEAIRHIAPGTHYVDTIKVEWEE